MIYKLMFSAKQSTNFKTCSNKDVEDWYSRRARMYQENTAVLIFKINMAFSLRNRRYLSKSRELL